MSWIDWIILLLPLMFVIYMGYRSRRYVKGVADFLAAGRICGRYVICVADVVGALAVITLVAQVDEEEHAEKEIAESVSPFQRHPMQNAVEKVKWNIFQINPEFGFFMPGACHE